ncbi:MAG: type 11 [Planctomycetota bacterium]|nr:MAG: type 11 [Planctomycetota bacterium]
MTPDLISPVQLVQSPSEEVVVPTPYPLPPANSPSEAAPPALEIQRSAVREVRLDLACGQSPREGFEGVDIWPGAKHQLNLLRFPWPWADNSVDELHCSHFVEHIPMAYLTPQGDLSPVPTTPADKDLFFAFFDECWRILKPGGLMTVIVPALRSNRAFQDPTHRRFLPAEAFLYLNRAWREANKLDHYGVACNFVGPLGDGIPAVDGQVPMEEGMRALEVQIARAQTLWNVVADWVARLKKGAISATQ